MEGKENTKGTVTGSEEEDEDDSANTGDDQQTGGSTSDPTNTNGSTNDDNGGKKERKFSQSQVNRMMTREKNQGRAAAFKEMGIDPRDTKMVKMFQAFIESQKTDDQKAAEKDAAARQAQEEAEHRAKVAEAKAEAMMLGVKPQYVEDAVTLAMSKVSDDTDLKTILNELKEKYSVWFEVDEDGDSGKGTNRSKTGQKGTGASVKEAGKKGSKEFSGMGARLAAQRVAASSKKSYWGSGK